nr:hypothetical protein GCM10020092_001300 [Actinoplanes digitatis]
MGKGRAAAVAGLVGLLIVTGAGPAAADSVPVVTSTGLAEGQLIGIQQTVRPSVSADTVRIDVLVDDRLVARSRTAPFAVTLYAPVDLDDRDVDVTVRAYDVAGGDRGGQDPGSRRRREAGRELHSADGLGRARSHHDHR